MGMSAFSKSGHSLRSMDTTGIARAVVPPMHLSTRHGWPDVHVVAVSCVTDSQSGDPKSEPPDVWRCYGASVAPVAPVLPAAAEMFLGAWQHGIEGEYPINLYL